MPGIGGEIKRRREELGMSQPQVAVKAGVAVSAVSQIENGRRSPNVGTLEKIADALGVEVVDLFPKGQASLPFEDAQRHDAVVAALKDVYEEVGDTLFDRWEGELKEKVEELAAGKHDAFFYWLQGIRDVGRPYVTGLITFYASTTDNELQAVIGVSPFLQAWSDLWHRIEDAVEEAKESDPGMKFSQEDEKKFHAMAEEARAVR